MQHRLGEQNLLAITTVPHELTKPSFIKMWSLIGLSISHRICCVVVSQTWNVWLQCCAQPREVSSERKRCFSAQMCWIRDQIDDSLRPDLSGIKTEELSHPLCSTWLFPGVAEEFGVVLAQSGSASTSVAKDTHCW